MRVLRGVVYMTKSSGPRTEPWGTLQEYVYQEDRSVCPLTRTQRDDRYDLNQLRTEPWIPNQDERRVIKMSWSIVLKASERSSRQSQWRRNCGDIVPPSSGLVPPVPPSQRCGLCQNFKQTTLTTRLY